MIWLKRIWNIVVEYAILLVIVIWVLWWGVFIIARTYLWNTSQLVILANSWVHRASLHINARLVYHDLNLLGFRYPIHITLPWSQSVDCDAWRCEFVHIPSGEWSWDIGTQQEQIFIPADTKGTIDARDAFSLQMDTEISLEHNLRDVSWSHKGDALNFFDPTTEQSWLVSVADDPVWILRSYHEDGYYILIGRDIWYFNPSTWATQIIESSQLGESVLSWKNGMTTVTIQWDSQIYPSYLFWYDENHITDGSKVFSIIKNK